MDALNEFLNKRATRADEYREIIEKMMGDWEAYHYAESTLLSILDYIDENNCITEGQVNAVENIKAEPSRRNGLQNKTRKR